MTNLTTLLTAITNIQASLEQMKVKLGSHQEIRTNHENMDIKINANQAKMDVSQAEIGAEIKTIQEKMIEEVIAQVGSLTSWIDANHEDMKEEIKYGQVETKATVSTILQKMRSWRK
jgi:hypothetical protein